MVKQTESPSMVRCFQLGACLYTDHCREQSAFSNPARNDSLILRHWKRREDTAIASLATPADSNVASEMDMEEKERATKVEPYYPYAKFNVKVNVPEYTQEQYDLHLQSDEWSQEETDYLVSLALEYDLRWVVIWDRYEYQPAEEAAKENEDSMAVAVQSAQRSMEDLKARYYNVAAKAMALNQPLSSMSTTEFELHEKMTKFDAQLEATRKKLAETLFARSPEEVKEEEILLVELKRIVSSQEKFAQERKDLYDRLSVPHSTGGATYKTSQELLQLMQTLLIQDKNKKRRSLAGEGSSTSNGATTPGTGQAERSHRQSISGPADKRSSLSGNAGLGPGQKQLSARDEAKFGISHNERTQTGTQFRHERINKLAQAKSNVLSTKIASALTELGIPNRLTMPTAAVCDEFERLVQSIHVLLDVRKVSEKLENEIKVARASLEDNQGTNNGEGAAAAGNTEPPVDEDDEGDVEGDVEGDAEGEGDEAEDKDEVMDDAKDEDEEKGQDAEEVEEADAAPARSESMRKRSASVVSHLSNKSGRSTKRQKK